MLVIYPWLLFCFQEFALVASVALQVALCASSWRVIQSPVSNSPYLLRVALEIFGVAAAAAAAAAVVEKGCMADAMNCVDFVSTRQLHGVLLRGMFEQPLSSHDTLACDSKSPTVATWLLLQTRAQTSGSC